MRLFSMRIVRARALVFSSIASVAVAALIVGCGSNYRPVVTPITPTGPEPQPSSFAAVVSAPSSTSPGIATIIDYSGDTVMAQSPIGPGPLSFTVDESGSTGYTINSDGTLTNFQISSQLQAKNLQYSTLPAGTSALNLFSPSSGLWIADLNGNVADVLTGYPETFRLAVPVLPTPVLIAGSASVGQRDYVISQIVDTDGIDCNNSPTTVGTNGVATPIETATNTSDTAIELDPFNSTGAAGGTTNAQCPVYAIQSPDGNRFFVLNRGSDTVSVINSQNNTLDKCTPFTNQSGQLVTCHPILPLSLNAVSALQKAASAPGAPTGIPVTPPNGTTGMTATAGPVYAEYDSPNSLLVVADYDGGTISVIDVSLDQYGNDSPTFGTTYTVKVGTTATPYPASVTVLADGSRAYTANQGDGTTDGTVTIVNLSSDSVEKTIPVTGHPRSVVSTQNSLQGKVYVSSPDSPYLTILRTDLDIVDTTVLIQGNIVDVRVSSQNGVSGNVNNTSRIPGYGEPCYLPPTILAASSTVKPCQTLPTAAQ